MKEEYCIVEYNEPNSYICEMCDHFIPKVKTTIGIIMKARRFSDEEAKELVDYFNQKGQPSKVKRVVVEYTLKEENNG
jgi:hypothetical protein